MIDRFYFTLLNSKYYEIIFAMTEEKGLVGHCRKNFSEKLSRGRITGQKITTKEREKRSMASINIGTFITPTQLSILPDSYID